MVDTRNITRIIMDRTIDTEEDLVEEINVLEESKIEERYIVDIEERTIKNLNSLLEYYDKLDSNIDRLNFYNFVSYVIKDEEQITNFFKELKNLSLLTHTGLLKYAHRQENYSKQVISNFLLKLSKIEESDEENLLEKQIDIVNKKLNNLREYKSFFAPIGIVREVTDPNSYLEFLSNINLKEYDKVEALLMSFNFNVLLHEEMLAIYELDLPKISDCVTKITTITTNPNDIKKKANKRKINSILKKIKNNKIKLKDESEKSIEVEKKEIIQEPVLIEALKEEKEEEKEYRRLEEATKKVMNNKDKDPFVLFNEYYDTLLGNEIDTKSITIVEEYLDKHHKLIDNIEPIIKKDLEDTYNVYKNNETLREEVYKTTENIERLLTYEINEIFSNIDVNDSENLVVITKKVEPIAACIKELESTKKK